MSELSAIEIANVNGTSLTAFDYFYSLKVQNRLGAVKELIAAHLVRAVAEREGIQIAGDELQEATDAFRRTAGLHTAADTHLWLLKRRMTVDDLEHRIRGELLDKKVCDWAVGAEVEPYFQRHRNQYDQASLVMIQVTERGIAEELMLQLDEEETTFNALAGSKEWREQTTTIGLTPRKKIHADVAPAVFKASPGEVVGPLEVDGVWHLIQVTYLYRAVLDEKTRDEIAKRLYADWLAGEMRRAKINVPLLEELSPRLP